MKVVEAHLRVRYAETDQMGVAYHANYLLADPHPAMWKSCSLPYPPSLRPKASARASFAAKEPFATSEHPPRRESRICEYEPAVAVGDLFGRVWPWFLHLWGP
jgi:hypothetical protein